MTDTDNGGQQTPEEDPYAPVLRSLPKDLVVTINGSDAGEAEIGEMVVTRVEEDFPVVHLNAGETWAKIQPNPHGEGFVYVEMDDGGRQRNWTDVITIEVVGFA